MRRTTQSRPPTPNPPTVAPVSGARASRLGRAVLRVVFLLGASGATLACKPDVGSSCERGEARCLDDATQLVCSETKMIRVPCRGPEGCGVRPGAGHGRHAKGVFCDTSKNQVGDPCSKDEEGAALCAASGKSKIVCRSGAYADEPCRGPKGCRLDAGRAACDDSVSQPGDSCSKDGRQACSVDGASLLACRAGKMQVSLSCRGSGGCQSLSGKLDCDFTVAKLGDLCPAQMKGKHACSTDRTGLVICRGGKFVADKTCDKGSLCSTEGGRLRCEKGEIKAR